jgi:hypothetical protein
MPKGTAATARAREIRCDTWSREREKDSVYPIARRRRKAKSQKFVKKGAHDASDLNPRGYEQEIGEAMSAQRGAWRMKDESDEIMSAQRSE